MVITADEVLVRQPTIGVTIYNVQDHINDTSNHITNGDSHDHNGGDGAQIDHTTLSNKGTNTHTQIDTHVAATVSIHNFDASGDASPQSHNNTKHTNRTRNIWIGPNEWILRNGTPILVHQGTNTRYIAWAFDSASTEAITTEFVIPEDYVSGALTVKIYWTNLGAGSGNVMWGINIKEEVAGSDLNNTTTEIYLNNTVTAPALGILSISTHTATITPSAVSIMTRITMVRAGADALDTLGNDAGFLGLEIEYTADM